MKSIDGVRLNNQKILSIAHQVLGTSSVFSSFDKLYYCIFLFQV